jgi:VWFA-related protein
MSARLTLTFVLLASTLSLGAAPQIPVFSSRVEAVRVDILVTRDGKPLRNLGPADFDIFDNGVRQQVDLVSFEQLPLNLVLTLDMSNSVVGERLAHLRSAGLGLLDGLRSGDRAALITFNHAIALGSDLSGEWERVRTALKAAEPAGNTSLIDACFAGIMVGESNVGRALVIVFSDGVDTSSWLAADSVLEIAKRSDAVVYAVSVGQGRNGGFLRDLSAQTGGRLFEVESTKDLRAVFLTVLDEFRQRYVVSYSPSGVSADGWHTLTVRVKQPNDGVKARPGYLAGR